MSPYAKTLIFWVAFVICGGSMYIFWDLCLNPELAQGSRGVWLLGTFLSCIISGGICVLMVIPEDEGDNYD